MLSGSLTQDPERDSQALTVFAERSGGLPMRVFFDYRNTKVEYRSGNPYKIIIETINRLRSRIRTLSFILSHQSVLYEVLNRIRFHQLEKLLIEVGDEARGLDSLYQFDLPSVREVTLITVDFSAPLKIAFDVDFKKPHNELEGSHLMDCFRIITYSCTQIFMRKLIQMSSNRNQKLQLGFSSLEQDINPFAFVALQLFGAQGYMLPQVISLSIADMNSIGHNAAFFFNYARLPALESLSVVVNGGVRLIDIPWPSLPHMLEMCKPPLKNLSISGLPMTSEDLLECLHYTEETLEYLSIDGRIFDKDVVSSLTIRHLTPGNPICFCPKMTVLRIQGASPCPAENIMAMVLSRLVVNRSSTLRRTFGLITHVKEIKLSNPCENLRRLFQFPEIQELIAEGKIRIYFD